MDYGVLAIYAIVAVVLFCAFAAWLSSRAATAKERFDRLQEAWRESERQVTRLRSAIWSSGYVVIQGESESKIAKPIDDEETIRVRYSGAQGQMLYRGAQGFTLSGDKDTEERLKAALSVIHTLTSLVGEAEVLRRIRWVANSAITGTDFRQSGAMDQAYAPMVRGKADGQNEGNRAQAQAPPLDLGAKTGIEERGSR